MRAEVESQLQEHLRVSLVELIYNYMDHVYVYKGRSVVTGEGVAVKMQKLLRTDLEEKLVREARNMQQLEHPNVLRLLSCFWYNNQQRNSSYLVLVTEYCSKDLMKDIKHRQAAAFYWEEAELWQHVYTLISIFAYMESLHIAHRDIKPNNIFLIQNTIKVGDLGSSVMQEDQLFFTMTGTPSYLSPILFSAYLKNESKVKHNVFKSDVWSLGLTFLTMANLEVPTSHTTLANLANNIEIAVRGVPYSDYFKEMVRAMLQMEEENRPSFTDLYTALNPIPQTVEEPPAEQPICECEPKTEEPVNSDQIQIIEDVQDLPSDNQGRETDLWPLPAPENEIPRSQDWQMGSDRVQVDSKDGESENELMPENQQCEERHTEPVVREPKEIQLVHSRRNEKTKIKSCCQLM